MLFEAIEDMEIVDSEGNPLWQIHVGSFWRSEEPDHAEIIKAFPEAFVERSKI